MLLVRNAAGEPELREWRTVALTDPSGGGRKPQQITGIRRMTYAFYDRVPDELRAVTETFVGDVDRAVAR